MGEENEKVCAWEWENWNMCVRMKMRYIMIEKEGPESMKRKWVCKLMWNTLNFIKEKC